VLCELAIVACDLAEVLGAAIGLQLLTGIPLLWGVVITSLDVLLLLALSRYGMRKLEALIVTLVATIGGCFAVEMILSRPDVPAILASLVPRDATGAPSLFARVPGGGLSVLGLHGESLYIAMGILGATVMPHNLYLHSSLVQSRAGSDPVLYLKDPEANTVEIYIDTPWHVSQPHGEPLDLAQSDEEILRETEAHCRRDPSFMPMAQWQAGFSQIGSKH
jgi:NRAMP (natural resistance-associated macrophage protein)-like metal ion transporter